LTQRRFARCHVWQAESTAVTARFYSLCIGLGQETAAIYKTSKIVVQLDEQYQEHNR